MKEADIIAKTDETFGGPITSEILIDDLSRLGVGEGDILLVHSSLSSIGWISGAAETLIWALLELVGDRGTLVMPAHSGALSNPALWEHPPVPASWQQQIRDSMPAFNPDLTSTRGIGIVPELFRHFPGTRRSPHPMDSFCAFGQGAERITGTQVLEDGLGEGGPLAHLYDLGARVLLLGCGHDTNTSLHLAEHRAEWMGKKRIRQGSPIQKNGRRIWKWFEELDLDTDDFPSCGAAFEKSASRSGNPPELAAGKVGLADSRLISQRALVDFATSWFTANRKGDTSPKAEQ